MTADVLTGDRPTRLGVRRLPPAPGRGDRLRPPGRDSVVVLPTGGGKSLRHQAPAAHLRRLAVVEAALAAGRVHLLYVAPGRLVLDGFLEPAGPQPDASGTGAAV